MSLIDVKKSFLILNRYPQGSSLRTTPGSHVLKDIGASDRVENEIGNTHEYHEDSSSHYDKSDKDSPLHRYGYKNAMSLNKGEHQVGER